MKRFAISGCMALGACAFTSCEDFLTIYPTTQIVEENFWEDKSDLESVVAACYARMIQGDMMQKYIIYGEVRSDNFNPRDESAGLFNMMNANLLPTEGYYDWTPFYQAINWCNKVIERGESVVARDESFTMGDWMPIRAEMITLRALNYFYLVRTWGDVPLVLEAYNDDSQDPITPQTSQEVILNTIIPQLEEVMDDALQKYTNNRYTKGRITQKAVHALLADMYLWRGAFYEISNPEQSAADYRKAIEYSDLVIQNTKREREEQVGESNSGVIVTVEVEDLLMENSATGFDRSSGAYNQIFGTGNSRESIFEFQFEGNSSNNNSTIGSFYGGGQSITNLSSGSLVASSLFQTKSASVNGDATGVYYKTDLRRWENVMYTGAAQMVFPISKYVCSRIEQQILPDNEQINNNIEYNLQVTSNNSSNWIVYRLSEMFLIKAEAISRLYPNDMDQLELGFHYMNMVAKRSNPVALLAGNTAYGDTIRFSSVGTGDDLTALVMTERQREFYGEGKRWFDLVRIAQRNGGTKDMLDLLVRKYDSNKNAIRSKLGTMNSLFFPVADSEMRKNNTLVQNPAWEINSNVSKN